MSTLYADRGQVSMNGQEFLDVTDITLNIADGTKYVPTMTTNRRYKGVVKGNRDIKVHIGVAVQQSLSTPKLESIDYQAKDIALTFAHGADRYTVIGMNFVDMDQAASGVGTEGKKGWNFIATDIVDQAGNSALFAGV